MSPETDHGTGGRRRRRGTGASPERAKRLAKLLGFGERKCEWSGCGKVYEAVRKKQRWCDYDCKNAYWTAFYREAKRYYRATLLAKTEERKRAKAERAGRRNARFLGRVPLKPSAVLDGEPWAT